MVKLKAFLYFAEIKSCNQKFSNVFSRITCKETQTLKDNTFQINWQKTISSRFFKVYKCHKFNSLRKMARTILWQWQQNIIARPSNFRPVIFFSLDVPWENGFLIVLSPTKSKQRHLSMSQKQQFCMLLSTEGHFLCYIQSTDSLESWNFC